MGKKVDREASKQDCADASDEEWKPRSGAGWMLHEDELVGLNSNAMHAKRNLAIASSRSESYIHSLVIRNWDFEDEGGSGGDEEDE
ncbi:hypothetical protein TWF225_003505 [Orbilia oligospora]|uniref:Uncharacterized protein n=1 Tax=Orbilia oligospora TaxID=2813651 RepID=A0A7C8U884_ORBOL|nr:hypothetical protein TWF225_003505 [Orbilia oligospora]KAF3182125.1 hypothetical protein TWF751_007175 [Orbilia oligospora]KAF3235449.1 hypothetical protein TWF217_003127 [Orbilia oligospora]KAF3236719.1 hypothetical protein TWF128_001292 [Orbilia oligospora]KAF3285879.1 hypothetical protein TWF132_009092 [Orbilia oligospora]